MLNKKIFIVAGLPRSGSTLLMNILGQNDAFFVTPTSGILDIIVYIRNSWNNNPALLATDRQSREARQIAVMRGGAKVNVTYLPKGAHGRGQTWARVRTVPDDHCGDMP